MILWIGTMTWFVIRESQSDSGNVVGGLQLLEDLGAKEGQEWFGIYLVSQSDEKLKIGFSVSEHEERENTHVMVNKSWMRLKVQGKEKTIRTETKILTDRDYTFINLNFLFSTDTIKFEVLATVEGKNLRLTITTAAGEEEKIIALDKIPVLPETIMARAVAEGLVIGKTMEMPVFDPTSFTFSDTIVKVVDSKVNENGITFWKLTSSFKGINTITWIDSDGKVQWQQAANFLTIRETKRDAFNKGWSNDSVQQDIIDKTKITVSRKIENPKTVAKLTLKISGDDFSDMVINGGRQLFDPESKIVTITKEKIDLNNPHILPVDKEAFSKWLEKTPTIQTHDPMIVQQMEQIVGIQTDAGKISRLILRWVFDTLEKKPLVSIPSARDVLEIKRGDCNEHSALYTALARAAGIPTKIVVGVVYQNGAFYYHAWNSVYLTNEDGQSGQWVEVDSTFGQYPADATHLRLQEGDLDKQIVLIRLLGKLQIDVVFAE